jgi:aspartate kinase
MSIIVQKYGGSSVATPEKLRRVAELVVKRKRTGVKLVVVVSAMGDTTDELLGLASKISQKPPRRELDMLLTCGERISMALLCMAIAELGEHAVSFTGSQSGIITDDNHFAAKIVEVRPDRLWRALDDDKIVIVAGYQGMSTSKEITTLGRGGSDTTAVALAAALTAEACEIYSDVDGVFSADPRIVANAQRIEAMSYREMETFAGAGAKVLNQEAVRFAREAGIKIHAKKTGLEDGRGTIVEASPTKKRVVAGVAVKKDVLAVEASLSHAELWSILGTYKATPEAYVSVGDRIAFALDLENVPEAGALQAALQAARANCSQASVVSLVGEAIGSKAELVNAAVLSAKKATRISIESHRIVACVRNEDAADLTRAWHDAFL